MPGQPLQSSEPSSEACVSHTGVMHETGGDKRTPSYRHVSAAGRTRGRTGRRAGGQMGCRETLPARRQHVSDTPAEPSQPVMDGRHIITSVYATQQQQEQHSRPIASNPDKKINRFLAKPMVRTTLSKTKRNDLPANPCCPAATKK